MKIRIQLLLPGILLAFFAMAQPGPTPASDRMKVRDQNNALVERSLVSEVPFQAIGPTIFSGRVVDIDVSPTDPSHFYVAYASGGLWKTENNGTSFKPLFDHEDVISIGDVAVDWSRNIIWLGSGENNSSRSSYAGNGIYKSTDNGKTWQFMGLPESQHIGRIILDPKNPDHVVVAVLGHLYSPNPERGVYMTTDGGKTWQQTLFVDDNAGAIELIQEPGKSNILYAATWHRERRAWNFVEAGKGSGIYKSTNGGKTWTLLTTEASGFPTGDGVGRIGMDAVRMGNQLYLYAIVDNYNRRPKDEKEDQEALTKAKIKELSKEDFLNLKDKTLKKFLSDNRFPAKYTVQSVKSMVRQDKIVPAALAEYLEDANALLFDTEVIGAEVYLSTDAGKTWKKTHESYLDGLFYSYGYYFGQIRIAPQNPQQLYVLGVPVLRSDDGGKNWSSIDGDNVHSDHHALWADPNRAGHLILGNDGGINISYDNGASWVKCNTPNVGQYYHISVDMEKPYNIYGGLQDNGVWYGPSNNTMNTRWQDNGQYPFQEIGGGDGMQSAVDTRDNETVYAGSQFGNYYRTNKNKRRPTRITPVHDLGEHPFRWNWQAPIWLSTHNQDILYMGSNVVHRSLNQGDDFEVISGDLTNGGKTGDVAFGTLTTIHESPLQFGLLYTGSDDGLIHVTKDGGGHWTNISTGLPKDLWVARVQASAHEKSRVYAALNGYRWDDFTPYLYVSEDFGNTWTALGKDLPMSPINVVKEDPVNPDILYVGTDLGAYLSLDRGISFMALSQELPSVPVHDLIVHPRDHDLILATHGRSLYVGSVSEVEKLTPDLIAKNLALFDLEEQRYSGFWGRKFSPYFPVREPALQIPVYSQTAQKAELQVLMDDIVLYSSSLELKKGIQYPTYDLSFSEAVLDAYSAALNKDKKEDDQEEIKPADNGKYYLRAGKYQLILKSGEDEVKKTITIK